MRIRMTLSAVLLLAGCQLSPASDTPQELPTEVSTSASGVPASTAPAASNPAKPLTGKVIVIDPGHNERDGQYLAETRKMVPMGGGRLKKCDEIGASISGGTTEAHFNLDVSVRVATILRAQGAKVVFTHDDPAGLSGPNPKFGPCINQRAEIGNKNHADAAISIHADGSPAANYGFAILEPAKVSGGAPINAKLAESHKLGLAVRQTVRPVQSYSTNLGTDGILPTADLGGLNLSAVPKVFIECANMPNSGDAAKIESVPWRRKMAKAIAQGLRNYVLAR